MSNSDIIIITTPSLAIPEVLMYIKKYIEKNQRIIIVLTSKGADVESGLTPYEFAQKTFKSYPNISIIVVSVVGFAEGIINREITKALVSSEVKDKKANRAIQTLLGTNYFVTEKSYNPRDVCLCGLLKNAFAIIIGICEGMKNYTYSNGQKVLIGENTRAALVDECSKEMLDIGEKLYIERFMIEGLTGKIDLELSCSPKGRNYNFGCKLAQGEKIKDIIFELGTVEGIGATRYLAKVTGSQYIKILNNVLDEKLSLKKAVGIILNDTNILKLLD